MLGDALTGKGEEMALGTEVREEFFWGAWCLLKHQVPSVLVFQRDLAAQSNAGRHKQQLTWRLWHPGFEQEGAAQLH